MPYHHKFAIKLLSAGIGDPEGEDNHQQVYQHFNNPHHLNPQSSLSFSTSYQAQAQGSLPSSAEAGGTKK